MLVYRLEHMVNFENQSLNISTSNIYNAIDLCIKKPYSSAFDYLTPVTLFRHLLIAFGGLAGLEECFEEDKNMKVCISITST